MAARRWGARKEQGRHGRVAVGAVDVPHTPAGGKNMTQFMQTIVPKTGQGVLWLEVPTRD